ncbi:MAG: NFACT family protein [archaeon]
MEIEINYTLGAGRNAENKYNERNKYKGKLSRLGNALKITETKLVEKGNEIKTKRDKIIFEKKKEKTTANLWYHKFRWFFTSNNYLVLAGRDARNNEVLVKKHMDDQDVYFHAEIHGAPHVVLKNPNKDEISEEDRSEAATFAGMFSSAWKSKIFSIDVYSTTPDQVTKTANTGESVGSGAFVIRGKRDYFRKLDLTCGLGYDEKLGIISGPYEVIKHKQTISKICFKLIPGEDRKSTIVAELKRKFEKKGILVTTEEIDCMLPPGDCKLVE